MLRTKRNLAIALALCTAPLAATTAAGMPNFVEPGSLVSHYYDGQDNDLLTGGLGLAGLMNPTPPGFTDSLNPTWEEMRIRTIHNNYRALYDTTDAGGFGRLVGPNVNNPYSSGLIPGTETLAYGSDKVTMMVQVPDHFDPQQACIVTGPSSGSRGVFGAIGSSGDWGLKKGCAVAYSDVGKGFGFQNIDANTAGGMLGQRLDANDPDVNFSVDGSTVTLANRFAIKHAHSQLNPESKWGTYTLEVVEFAFWVLSEQFPQDDINPGNTLVIASSISNGGGASLMALEQDFGHLIDGLVVSEPNVQPFTRLFSIDDGANPKLDMFDHSKSLADYYTYLNIYQPCALLTEANQATPFAFLLDTTSATNRCNALASKGMLQGDTLAELADHAQEKLWDYGFLPEQDRQQALLWFAQVQPAIATLYANSYGRYAVGDHLCGFSYGATDATGQVVPLPADVEANLFAAGNAIPPVGGVNLIYNDSEGGEVDHRFGISASTGLADFSLDGALCLRDTVMNSWRVNLGILQLRHTGYLQTRPSIIIHGRDDGIIPVNHSSRAFYGANKLTEGPYSQLHYYEITNAHHLDSINAFAGFNDHYIPLHYYLDQGLDLMWNHLTQGQPLPASQVVRTVPRATDENGVVDLQLSNMPDIANSPASSDEITFSNRVVNVPE